MHLCEHVGEEYYLYRSVQVFQQTVAHQLARLGDLGSDFAEHSADGDRLFVVRIDKVEEAVVAEIPFCALVFSLFSRADIGYFFEVFRKRFKRERLFFQYLFPLVERMTRKVYVERLFFVVEEHFGRKFRKRRHVVRLFLFHKVEQRKLSAALLFLLVRRKVEHTLVARHQRRAGVAEAVERARLYQVFEDTLVYRARG